MSGELARRIEAELLTPAPEAVVALARALADPGVDAAILYYGSTLRTGDLSGILDFYRLTRRPHRRGLHGLVERVLWPEVSYHEVAVGGRVLRAKVATLPLATFRRAAEGRTLDTTIWARFVQPTQRVWSADAKAAADATSAVSAAVVTASRYAAALGPDAGAAEDFWLALFRKTYAAEFRVESTDRADTVMASGADRYAAILPLAWREGGVVFDGEGAVLRPVKQGLPGWTWPDLAGKPLNMARILKAAFTFDGAARYAAYKVERHTGIEIAVTPFRERHPFLAAPGAWIELRRRQRASRADPSSGR
ncbi:MAG: hypothetical protein KKE02_13505 [Alphaproteobacteria bacterium]|nr:hypothetical protein [Alphaproteobacteria bacterium]MBU1516945.1 hypothetical protein [Alphaproteobacteria bacterium]MBU2095833.1 hypothetical protein [Alphaproteobacteria bacterium]MBU2152030.1 hypothetical protein [Alphaproteobacteria bacterium]MBU2309551.1 hypothetical protein [Alphaproteobacteria bacterium]